MDRSKHIVISNHVAHRIIQRDILNAFDSIETCVRDIKNAIARTGLIIPHPDKGHPEYWCLFEINGVGLVKVLCIEEKNVIIATTIAHPVTDSRCIAEYKRFLGTKEKVK